jgi:hypothetical protein
MGLISLVALIIADAGGLFSFDLNRWVLRLRSGFRQRAHPFAPQLGSLASRLSNPRATQSKTNATAGVDCVLRVFQNGQRMFLEDILKIKSAKVLWIDADPVFGGSNSQVQFPVELSGFFYLPSNARFGAQTRVGVTAAGVDFTLKKMDFHHNQMWRLNLPTKRQGLGGYTAKVLVFERTAVKSRFRIWALDKGSPLFGRLRALCRNRGKVGSTRREDGSRRAFGFC